MLINFVDQNNTANHYTMPPTKYFFSSKVVNRWNLLDKRTVDAPSKHQLQIQV